MKYSTALNATLLFRKDLGAIRSNAISAISISAGCAENCTPDTILKYITYLDALGGSF